MPCCPTCPCPRSSRAQLCTTPVPLNNNTTKRSWLANDAGGAEPGLTEPLILLRCPPRRFGPALRRGPRAAGFLRARLRRLVRLRFPIAALRSDGLRLLPFLRLGSLSLAGSLCALPRLFGARSRRRVRVCLGLLRGSLLQA